MADRNDFKILRQRCIRHFELAKDCLNAEKKTLTDDQKARYGFYFFVIQNLTNIEDYDEIAGSITDMEFNSSFFGDRYKDEGIDAVCIDDQSRQISLFNFKYRNDFDVDKKQSKNDLIITSKFLSALKQENVENLKGKLKLFAGQIIRNNNSDEIWETTLYYVSNENKTLAVYDPNIKQMAELYGITVKAMGLNELVELTSLHPKNIDATLVLPRDAVMSFTENSLASSKSYIVRLPLTELIRITCDNAKLRGEYNIEDDEDLYDTNVDVRVLFDNVRGFILKSKYNNNIESTLEKEPSKFFTKSLIKRIESNSFEFLSVKTLSKSLIKRIESSLFEFLSVKTLSKIFNGRRDFFSMRPDRIFVQMSAETNLFELCRVQPKIMK